MLLFNDERIFCSRKDRYFSTRRTANHAGELCPFDSLAGHCGDAEQIALRVSQKVGQADGIIDVHTDIGVEQNFFSHGKTFHFLE
ncbi:MAG: hypothetical protein BWY77_01664 [bacterium ADurb.Bin431]|nr:MAG: hypothetical protein BWY77_01664 [bacterium ADurb.Bin431]